MHIQNGVKIPAKYNKSMKRSIISNSSHKKDWKVVGYESSEQDFRVWRRSANRFVNSNLSHVKLDNVQLDIPE